jgi:hypothetical protein
MKGFSLTLPFEENLRQISALHLAHACNKVFERDGNARSIADRGLKMATHR